MSKELKKLFKFLTGMVPAFLNGTDIAFSGLRNDNVFASKSYNSLFPGHTPTDIVSVCIGFVFGVAKVIQYLFVGSEQEKLASLDYLVDQIYALNISESETDGLSDPQKALLAAIKAYKAEIKNKNVNQAKASKKKLVDLLKQYIFAQQSVVFGEENKDKYKVIIKDTKDPFKLGKFKLEFSKLPEKKTQILEPENPEQTNQQDNPNRLRQWLDSFTDSFVIKNLRLLYNMLSDYAFFFWIALFAKFLFSGNFGVTSPLEKVLIYVVPAVALVFSYSYLGIKYLINKLSGKEDRAQIKTDEDDQESIKQNKQKLMPEQIREMRNDKNKLNRQVYTTFFSASLKQKANIAGENAISALEKAGINRIDQPSSEIPEKDDSENILPEPARRLRDSKGRRVAVAIISKFFDVSLNGFFAFYPFMIAFPVLAGPIGMTAIFAGVVVFSAICAAKAGYDAYHGHEDVKKNIEADKMLTQKNEANRNEILTKVTNANALRKELLVKLRSLHADVNQKVLQYNYNNNNANGLDKKLDASVFTPTMPLYNPIENDRFWRRLTPESGGYTTALKKIGNRIATFFSTIWLGSLILRIFAMFALGIAALGIGIFVIHNPIIFAAVGLTIAAVFAGYKVYEYCKKKQDMHDCDFVDQAEPVLNLLNEDNKLLLNEIKKQECYLGSISAKIPDDSKGKEPDNVFAWEKNKNDAQPGFFESLKSYIPFTIFGSRLEAKSEKENTLNKNQLGNNNNVEESMDGNDITCCTIS